MCNDDIVMLVLTVSTHHLFINVYESTLFLFSIFFQKLGHINNRWSEKYGHKTKNEMLIIVAKSVY